MYARKVEENTLTFSVSGKLWNRSLIMLDKETGSLWSHILGKAMQGPLEGTELETLPSDVVTWEAWREEHPNTTLLNMRNTSGSFNSSVYQNDEKNFVFGWAGHDGQTHHASYTTLFKKPLQNLTLARRDVLLTYDRKSAAARLFSRKLKLRPSDSKKPREKQPDIRKFDGRALSFIADQPGLMKDEQTGSTWKMSSGKAIEGPLKGESLKQRVGIVSFKHAWEAFHPDSHDIATPLR